MGSIRLSGLNSGMDTDSMIKKIMDAEKLKLKKIDDKKVTLDWKKDKWKDLNTKLYNLYTKHISSLRLENAYDVKKGTSSNESLAKVSTNFNASVGEHNLEIKEIAKTHMITGAKVQDLEDLSYNTTLYELDVPDETVFKLTVNGNTETLTVDTDTTIKDFVDFAKKAGIHASFDLKQRRFYLSSKEEGASKSFELTEEHGGEEAIEGRNALGIRVKGLDEEGEGATEIKGRDATYRLNEVEYTSTSNDVTVNGLKISLLGATEGYGTPSAKSIRVGVSTNVDESYKKFKAFIKEYNSILKEMNDLYYAGSASKYKPLSKEEKDQMSEKEVEEWEGKIKASILRRDASLGSVLNSMKSALGTSINVEGENFSLASFGVMTSTAYLERGLLHMFGDEEDGVYSGKADKFKKLLTEEPEKAGKALQGIMEGLYNKMTEGMKSTPLSSALTFYNDKEYKNLEDTYKKQYNTMEEKLKAIEDKYYRQFAAMEKAMAKMNQQTNSLAGLLGGR